MLNRNTEARFNSLPQLKFGRSRHKYQKDHKTSFNTGDIVPIYANELVQPADTITMYLSFVIRMTTPYQPPMDNLYLDTYAFGIQWLDVWNYTKAFWGENILGAWAQTTEYIVPQITIPANTEINSHTLLAYLGFPQKKFTGTGTYGGGLTVNAYGLTYNEWFRDQNYIAPIAINYEGTTITYNENDITKGGKLLKAAKLHDRFTSGLPAPEKGTAFTMPVGSTAPVMGNGNPLGLEAGNGELFGLSMGSGDETGEQYALATFRNLQGDKKIGDNVGNGQTYIGRQLAWGVTDDGNYSGLYADLSQAVGAAFSAQRFVVAANHILENMGIYGSRYREIIRSQWGVESSDTAQHIPEYLGGKRTPLNIVQVTQTSAGSGNIGDTGAMSLTSDFYKVFTKSFTEHSIILVLATVRTDQTYGQGIPRQYLKERKLEYFWYELAHISFQPVYLGELWATGVMTEDKAAFSFLPAYNEYRSEQNMATGMFNPDYKDSNGNNTWLKEWTFTNKFANAPVMGQEFLEETVDNVDRTLVQQSSVEDQFIADFNFTIDKRSIVPTFGTPGLRKF